MKAFSPPDAGQRSNSEWLAVLLLSAVLAVALGVRLWMALSLPRFFDDHYVFNNISSFLNGSLRPRHSYYGTLSYLPQAIFLTLCDALPSWAGIGPLQARGTPFEGFTLEAFRIMRMFIIAYGLLSILMIYFVGRRLFSTRVGLAAAAVLAVYPQHIRSSLQLKPDMLALLFTLVTLYWTAGAVKNPRLSRFLLVGVGVGLAVSSKYIGLASALPLTFWAVASGFHHRRRWGWLVLAGVTSIVTFFTLNPFFSSLLYYGFRVTRFYANQARGEQSDHGTVLRRGIVFLADQHGWILCAFLLLGTGLLIHRLWRRPGNGEWAAALLPLSLFLGYPALHAAGLTLFHGHNLLPAEGGSALVCAYGMVSCGEWLLQRRPFARAPLLAAAAWILPGSLLLARPIAFAYAELVPSTWTGAEIALRPRLAPLRTRDVAYEGDNARLRLADGGAQTAARTQEPSLARLPPLRLDLADVEIFPLSRTEGAQAAFYEGRRQRLAPECVQEIHPRLFQRRGEPLLLLFHPWMPAGEPISARLRPSVASPGTLNARLPADLAEGDILSIELIRPSKIVTSAKLQPGGVSLLLRPAGQSRYRTRFTSPRFRFTTGLTRIQVANAGGADPNRFQLSLWRWTKEPCSGSGDAKDTSGTDRRFRDHRRKSDRARGRARKHPDS